MGDSPKPFQLQVYPNGEFAVYLQRKAAVEPVAQLRRTEDQKQTLRAVAAPGIERVRAYFGDAKHSLHLGLSTPPKFVHGYQKARPVRAEGYARSS